MIPLLTFSVGTRIHPDSPKDHPIKASRLMCKPLRGNHFMARLTQDNLGAHRVNLTRDNPRALEVRHIRIRVNLLDNQGSLLFSKANSVSSKGTHLDKLGQFIILKINQQSSKDILMGKGGNPAGPTYCPVW